MNDGDLLEFHRRLVATRSVSAEETPAIRFVGEVLARAGVETRVVPRGGILALLGTGGPVMVWNTHLDTVPPAPGWTGDPWTPRVGDGRVVGLGSNDAKASVAAMVGALLRIRREPGGLGGIRLALALAVEEETTGQGSRTLRQAMDQAGWPPAAVLVGEPTGMEPAVSQKGLAVIRVVARGDACHAAHARALGARNAIRELARVIARMPDVLEGADDPDLGPVTVEPTQIQGGTARNVVPGEASCYLDVRTNPGIDAQEVARRLSEDLSCEAEVHSGRFVPCRTDPGSPLVRAVLQALPGARPFASRGVSDWVAFRDVPAVKIGPGRTERSHTADEFVLEEEVLHGALAYQAIAGTWAREVTR